jgi:hypothetical protein
MNFLFAFGVMRKNERKTQQLQIVADVDVYTIRRWLLISCTFYGMSCEYINLEDNRPKA